jgi:hypothetical protein
MPWRRLCAKECSRRPLAASGFDAGDASQDPAAPVDVLLSGMLRDSRRRRYLVSAIGPTVVAALTFPAASVAVTL